MHLHIHIEGISCNRVLLVRNHDDMVVPATEISKELHDCHRQATGVEISGRLTQPGD